MRIQLNYIPSISLTMQQTKTITIQFLIIGRNSRKHKINERTNIEFPITATAGDVAQKRADLKSLHQSKGNTVEVFTVSPNLVEPIAS